MKKKSFIADQCMDIGLFVIGVLLLLILYFGIFKNIIDKIKDGVGPEVLLSLTLICFLFYALFLFTSFFWEYYCYRTSRKRNWTVFWTIFLMIFSFSVGSYLIINSYGEPKLDLVLRDSNNIRDIVGNISCSDNEGRLIAGERVFCEIYPFLQNASGRVTFILGNTHTFQDFDDEIVFRPPYDMERIMFQIRGIDNFNDSYDLQVSNDFKFLSKEDYDKREDKLITYFIILLGAVLFSVPSMMNNFKSLRD